MRVVIGGVASVLLFGSSTLAQDQTVPGTDLPLSPPPEAKQAPAAAAPSKFAAATRADWPSFYIRFERTLRDYPPAADHVADLNRAFDAATLKFIGGDYAPAIEALNELTDSLRYKGEVPPGARFASSLKISLDPVVAPVGGHVEITVAQMYGADAAPGPVLRFERGNGENSVLSPIGGPSLWREIDLPALENGASLQVVNGSDVCYATRIFATGEPFSLSRTRLTSMLAGVGQASPEMAQAVASCRARINLLDDQPSTVESAQFLANPIVLRDELLKEINLIRAGQDPYARRVGETWRVIKTAEVEIPCRVYAPAGGADGTTPHALIIALHGAGGDESMFFEGYGAGRIKHLADKHGFIVAAPLTYLVMGNGPALDSVIDAIAMTYSIDPKRVYVLGHSMGAGAAAAFAVQRPDRLAAACCIAGTGRFSPGAKIPPVLLIGGELDPLITAARIKAGAEAAIKAGLPIEYREAKDYGHTLLVGAKLDEAVEWLLAHQRD